MRPYLLDKQAMIPIACAVIHNFIKLCTEEDPLLQQYEGDAVPVADIDPKNADRNDGNDDEAENLSESSRSRVSRPQMKEFRDQMAVQMWEAFQERPWVH